MNRVRIFLTSVVLAAFAVASAQPAELPADPRFDQPVAFSTGMGGESLSAMLTALARSIDLTPVVDDIVDKTIVYDIGEAKPFRQVWHLILTLNDLDYLLQENDVVVIGTTESLARLRAPTAAAAEDVGEPILQRFYRVNNEVEQVVAVLRRAVAGIEVDPLPGTGAIVVAGTQAQQDDVATVLAEFDRPADVVPLEQRTYFLSNATAAELATTLQETGVVAGTGEDGAAETLVEGFSVVAEARTNSLIVTGTAAVQARLAELIAQLDAAQPQVNISVRIQEITRRSAIDLGIDWQTGFGNLTANVLGATGLNFIFDTTQVISSLNVLAVMDALETQGLSRRVDDSNITVLNNGTGSLQSGGEIFITIAGANENIERTIPYGVQVDVTPRITADGRVTLEIEASVDDVLSTTNDPSFLNLSSQSVTTTVTVEPGETLLLGGLLQSSLNVTRTRIPIIGSIPLIGDLFGTTVTEEDATDLLIIVSALILD
ncbi:MAG: secretin N-terminal domain-containing protein [Trueperaceae bacterium]|nr:secretin N-terminal domain-containing protein [Trueperaceae bacterium]